MKALTISQPFASMIISGIKWVENRTWSAPSSVVGQRIAIHAGKGRQYLIAKDLLQYPTGAILATARLEVCFNLSHFLELKYRGEKIADERISKAMFHVHSEGPVCWVLSDVSPCKPIVIGGKQGLWDVPEDIEEAL